MDNHTAKTEGFGSSAPAAARGSAASRWVAELARAALRIRTAIAGWVSRAAPVLRDVARAVGAGLEAFRRRVGPWFNVLQAHAEALRAEAEGALILPARDVEAVVHTTTCPACGALARELCCSSRPESGADARYVHIARVRAWAVTLST